MRLLRNASITKGFANALPYQSSEKPWKSLA